jgi:hypothetical protein
MKTATFLKVFDMHLEPASGSLVPEYFRETEPAVLWSLNILEKQNRRFFKIKELPNADIPNTYVCVSSA